MSLSVYKLKFKLYAAHSNFADKISEVHYHTFQLTTFIKIEKKEFDSIKCLAEIESLIGKWLETYKNLDLRQAELFRNKDTSIETLGNAFYEDLRISLKSKNCSYELIRLDISENPVRSYSVSSSPLDEYVNEVSYPTNYSIKKSLSNIRAELSKSDTDGSTQAAEVVSNEAIVLSELLLDQDSKVTNNKPAAKKVPEGNHASTPQYFRKKTVKLLFAVLFLLAASVTTIYIVQTSGVYPRGFDVMYHMYRSASQLESIKNGDWYPLYDKLLYNGVQVMRYWAPIPVYVLSLCSMTAGGLMNGYLLYLGFVLFLGGSGWLLFGWKHDRLLFAAIMGTVWFFIPDNLRVLFGSGNLPRGIITALLPWLLFYILEFLETKRIRDINSIIALTSIMALCHLGETGIVILCLILFLIVYALSHKNAAGPLWILPGIGVSFLLIGVWLYPSLQGGLLSMGEDNLQAMKSSFANGWKSLNPFERYHEIGFLYFGLTLFVICILGIALANRNTKPGFITGVAIYFGTTLSFYPVIAKMPFGDLFWMERFVTFAMASIFVSLFLWKELRKGIIVLLCLLIVIDCIPSLGYIYAPEHQRVSDPVQAQNELAKEDGLDKLKTQTAQRTALMDLSSYGSFAPYYLAGVDPKTPGTFGAAWQSAGTARNIVQLNTAFSSGYFDYLFDRCLDLGNDTVLIRIFLMKHGSSDVNAAVAAGDRLGYQLTYQDNKILLFSKKADGNFGVKTKYSAIAIGDSARDIALRYPAFKETTDGNLNHYHFEELKDFNAIYLSGFTFDDRGKAEKLLKKLSANGNRIYIDMNRIPTSQSTGIAEFLGVKAQEVSFEDSFPTLNYRGKEYTPYPFGNPLKDEPGKWNTVYLTGLKNDLGYSVFENKKIAFYGTGEDQNIYFMGFNLPYHVLTSFDKGLASMLDDMLGIRKGALPVRTIVPIQVSYAENSITVKTDEDGVNTTLAYQDIFRSDQRIYEDNNLLVVDHGVTRINLVYPYFKEGLLMSITGLLLLVGYLKALRSYYKKRREKGVVL